MEIANEALVERLVQAFNDGNLSAIDGLLAPDFVGRHPLLPGEMQGPQALEGYLAALRAAMPDAHHPSWTVISDGDMVAAHMSLEGTFVNPFMGIPANGRKVVVWMADIWRIAEGKIVEAWFNLDTLGLMRQLGAVPQPDKRWEGQ